MQLGAFEMSLCVVEPALIAKHPRQFVMNPKQGTVPIERRRDSEGYLEMVDCFLDLAPGPVYLGESFVESADPKFFTFLWEEGDCAECGFFCGAELFVIT